MSQLIANAETQDARVCRADDAARAAVVAAVNRTLAREEQIAKQVAIFREGVNLTDRLKLAATRGWFAPMVRDLLKQGVSVVVNGIGLTAPAARAVEATTGIPADWVFQQNLYITPKEVRGFLPHCDAHMVVVAHLYGRKEWFLYDRQLDNPLIFEGNKEVLYADAKAELPVRRRLVLEPGDMLVIPRGAYHAACALDGGSVHLAIGCAGIRPVDVIWELAGRAMKDSSLRADMDPAAAREAAAAFLANHRPASLPLPRNPLPETDVPPGLPALGFEEALRAL